MTITELLHLEMLNSVNMLISFSNLNFCYIFSYTILLSTTIPLFFFCYNSAYINKCSYCDLSVMLFLVFSSKVLHSLFYHQTSSKIDKVFEAVTSMMDECQGTNLFLEIEVIYIS